MKTLRGKLLLWFGLVLAVLLSLLGAHVYWQARASTLALTQEFGQEVLHARAVSIGYLFRGYLNDVRTLARDALIRTGETAAIASELARRMPNANPDYEMLLFADAAGDYVASNGAHGNIADRPYWQAVMQDGRAEVIGEPVISRATGEAVFVIAAAVTSPAGERIGLVAATVLLRTLSDIAGAIGIDARGFGWVADQRGLLIAHPNAALRLSLNLADSAAQGYTGLDEIARRLAAGESGIGGYRRPDGTRFVTLFAPIPQAPGWGLGVSLPKADLEARTHDLTQRIAWAMGGVLAAVLALVFLVSGRIAAPVRALMQGVQAVSGGDLERRLEIRTGDEIQALAESFNRMNEDLKTHIRELRQVTEEKARVDGELRAANAIQASMLPRIFPPFPQIDTVDLFATMEPAKEVGGDFYDFFLLDERRLCFCVGDVSGKGVPAALFMVISMTILRNLTLQGYPLSEVFTRANTMLCSESDMFVTVFMGILDAETGELEYLSAGHNPPLRSRRGSTFAYLDAPRHLCLGGIEHQQYRSARLAVEPGDLLFVYSDGLTEAMNASGDFFTDARMFRVIDALRGQSARAIVEGLRAAVEGFVGEAPAADDLTMLAIGILPPERAA